MSDVPKGYKIAGGDAPKGYKIASRANTSVNPVAGTVRAGLQGLTFGFSDEIGSAIGALAA